MVSGTSGKIRTKGKKVEVPPEDKEEILRLSKRGHGIAKISELTPYSRWTVHMVIKEARGDVAVRRERRHTVETTPEVKEIARPRTVGASRATAVAEVAQGPMVAKELESRILAATEEARRAMHQMQDYSKELEALWERAQRAADMELAFTEALATFKVLKQHIEGYKIKLAEIESKNAEKAAVVYSEGSLLRGT